MSEKKKKKKDASGADGEDGDMDMENLDWWSKYFASVETMIRVNTCFVTI